MQLQISIQDGAVYVSTEKGSVEISPLCLRAAAASGA